MVRLLLVPQMWLAALRLAFGQPATPVGITWGPAQSREGPTIRVSELARADVVLVGAGIMSATLGALLRRLEPDWSITLIERLDAVAAESSSPWNNAGTGHSALCEMNYTPAEPRRLDRHHQSGAHQRAIPGDPPVLGVRRRERHPDRRTQLPQPGPAREFRARGPARRLSATAAAGAGAATRYSPAPN